MARTCPLCDRGANNANSRSHSNIATARKQHINLQSLMINGRRVTGCTSCIRKETKRLNDLTKSAKKRAAST